MTEWPDYRQVDGSAVVEAMKGKLILDANRFLQQQFSANPQVVYGTVGKAL